MGIFSKYVRAYKVTELPATNIDKEALYIVSDGKDENIAIAVRNIDNNQWHILKGLSLGTTANTAAAGNHTHQLSDINGLEDKIDLMVQETQQAQSDAEAAWNLADSKEDKFTKNSAFNKNFGTTSTTVAAGNHTHSQYLTIDSVNDVINERKEFIGTYLNPITTPTVTFTKMNIGSEVVITYQGADIPTIVHEEGNAWKLNFIDVGIDFVPNQKCRIYLHIVDSLTTADELFIDMTVKPITLL